jgi:hypothetical protein
MLMPLNGLLWAWRYGGERPNFDVAFEAMSGAVEMRHKSNDTLIVTEHPPFPAYRASSERERRWVAMTFDEHQAWLARPDLDPVEFAFGEVAS